MKVNGIGMLNEQGEFQFHQTLFESFSIFDDTIMFGMFYPKEDASNLCPEDEQTLAEKALSESNFEDIKNENIHITQKKIDKKIQPYPLDFIFSPIPIEVWDKTARLILRVKNEYHHEALNEITEILKANEITILNSVTNRSSHSYATIDLYIAFENEDYSSLIGDHLNFDEKESNENGKTKDFSLKIKYGQDLSLAPFKVAVGKLINDLQKAKKSKDESIKILNTSIINSFNCENRFYNGTFYQKEVLLNILEKKFNDAKKNKVPSKYNNEETIEFCDYFFTSKELGRDKWFKIEVNCGLHYFHHQYKIRELKKEETLSEIPQSSKDVFETIGKMELYDVIYKPFTLRYSNGFVRQDGVDKITNMSVLNTNSKGKILNILYAYLKYFQPNRKEFTSLEENLPALTFIEGDSHFLNFRVAIIPSPDANRFLKLNFFYQRMTMPYSSKGLLNFVLNKIPDHYKIWRFHNRLFDCRETYGSGKMSFFLEDTRKFKNYGIKIETENAEAEFKTIANSAKEDQSFQDFVFKIKVESAKNIMFKHFEAQNNDSFKLEYDVFISHSSKDLNEAKHIQEILAKRGLSSYLSAKEIIGGDIFSDKIRSALVNSRELCILYSPNSIQSSWVISEWGAAWALKKRITPVLLDITAKGIPDEHERLKRLHYVRYREDELNDYAKKVKERRFFEIDNDTLTS